MLDSRVVAGTIIGSGLVVIFTENAVAGFTGLTITLAIYSVIDIYKEMTGNKSGLNLDK